MIENWVDPCENCLVSPICDKYCKEILDIWYKALVPPYIRELISEKENNERSKVYRNRS